MTKGRWLNRVAPDVVVASGGEVIIWEGERGVEVIGAELTEMLLVGLEL